MVRWAQGRRGVAAVVMMTIVVVNCAGGDDALDAERACRSIDRLLGHLAGGDDEGAKREVRRLRAVPGVPAQVVRSVDDLLTAAVDADVEDRGAVLDDIVAVADDGEVSCDLDAPTATALAATPAPTAPAATTTPPTEPPTETTETATTEPPAVTTVPDDEVSRPMAITGTPSSSPDACAPS